MRPRNRTKPTALQITPYHILKGSWVRDSSRRLFAGLSLLHFPCHTLRLLDTHIHVYRFFSPAPRGCDVEFDLVVDEGLLRRHLSYLMPYDRIAVVPPKFLW